MLMYSVLLYMYKNTYCICTSHCICTKIGIFLMCPPPRNFLPPSRNPWGGQKISWGGHLPPPRHPNDVSDFNMVKMFQTQYWNFYIRPMTPYMKTNCLFLAIWLDFLKTFDTVDKVYISESFITTKWKIYNCYFIVWHKKCIGCATACKRKLNGK